jgi:hypothetical protein
MKKPNVMPLIQENGDSGTAEDAGGIGPLARWTEACFENGLSHDAAKLQAVGGVISCEKGITCCRFSAVAAWGVHA